MFSSAMEMLRLDSQLMDLEEDEVACADYRKVLVGITLDSYANDDECEDTKRFTKEDANINLDPTDLPSGDAAYQALCRIRAFAGIGDAYFEYRDVRVKIKEAELANDGTLRLLTVTPAGKAPLPFAQYLQSLR